MRNHNVNRNYRTRKSVRRMAKVLGIPKPDNLMDRSSCWTFMLLHLHDYNEEILRRKAYFESNQF